MNTRRRRTAKSVPLEPQKSNATDSSASSRQNSTLPRSRSVFDECVGAISLVEVAIRSLDSQEIAFPEQEVLKRALKAIWCVHDRINELKETDRNDADRESAR